jgi:hypothetical protein
MKLREGCAPLLLSLAAAGCTATAAADDFGQSVDPSAATVGVWHAERELGVFGVHAALDPRGRALFFSGSVGHDWPFGARIYDPVRGSLAASGYAKDLFCSGHTWLADGRLLIAGGHPPQAPTEPSHGAQSSHLFDPATLAFTEIASLHHPRWYPTLARLADGRVLAAAGIDVFSGPYTWAPQPVEIYDPKTGGWSVVAGADRELFETYPALHLLPSGHLFHARVGWRESLATSKNGYLTFTGRLAARWTDLAGSMAYPDRREGAALLRVDDTGNEPKAEIWVVGGGRDADNGHPAWAPDLGADDNASVEILDATDVTRAPKWRVLGQRMHEGRTNPNALFLPNGKLLVVGGGQGWKQGPDEAAGVGGPRPVLEPEIYDPETSTWTLGPPMKSSRMYHSTALLLPDGSVLAAGGEDQTLQQPDRPASVDRSTMQAYAPPYFFKARPTMSPGSESLSYGASFDVQVSDGAAIAAVTLVSPGSLTHHTDAGRFVELGFSIAGAKKIRVRAPTSPRVAPPGHYLLFVVDRAGAPSLGRMVRLPVPASASVCPAAEKMVGAECR